MCPFLQKSFDNFRQNVTTLLSVLFKLKKFSEILQKMLIILLTILQIVV